MLQRQHSKNMKLPKLYNLKRNITIGIALSIVFSVVGIATAQELTRTITVVYPVVEQKLDAGKSAEGTTKIINQSNVPLTFNATVEDFIVVDNVGTPNILPPGTLNNKYSGASWIAISPSTFTLKPGENQSLNYFIKVPYNARPGGHYAAIVYTPDVKTKGAKNSGGVVQSQVGSLFKITVNGPVKESASVTKFFANPFQEYGPVNILTQIKNMGDLHFSPKGTVTVSGLFYNKTADLPKHDIFPETVRDFENSLGQTLMIGQYKAQLLASYGVNNNLPLTATIYFWVFPWRLAVVIVLVVIAVILGWMYWNKRKSEDSKGPKVTHNDESVKSEEETKAEESPKKVG